MLHPGIALFEALQVADEIVWGAGEPGPRLQVMLEGIVSKRLDAGYSPGQRGLWVKTKCLNREEFVVVGWTDPEGSRPFIGALLLGVLRS
jgi:hypothetical protein